jgi:acyl-CoA thioesterase FadM
MAKASAWLEFRFTNASNEVVATAQQRGLFMELATGRPRRLSPAERALFEPYLSGDEQPET